MYCVFGSFNGSNWIPLGSIGTIGAYNSLVVFEIAMYLIPWISLDSNETNDSLCVRGVEESVSRDYSSVVHKNCHRSNLEQGLLKDQAKTREFCPDI